MGEERIVVEVSRHHKEGDRSICSTGKCRLHFSMVAVQVAFSGFEVLSRLALDNGAGKLSFSFYRNCLAFLVLGVAALVLERKLILSLSFLDGIKIFLLGLIGVTINQVLYLTGLDLTSAVFASTLRNSIPVFTYILALLARRENLDLRTKPGRAKLAGCALGVFGSVLLSLYRGPVLLRSSLSVTHVNDHKRLRSLGLNKLQSIRLWNLIHFEIASWPLGALCLVFSCMAFASFLVLQAPLLDKYPAPISFATLCCFSSLVHLPLLAAVFESQHWSSWRRIPSSEALSIGYAGLVASGFVSAAQSWGVQKGGPVIVAAYQPLETVITAFLGLIFLKESLHLGSLLGALVVVTGLYLLVWGQGKEIQSNTSVPDPDWIRHVNMASKSSIDSAKVFPDPDSSHQSIFEDSPAVSVIDIQDNSNKWRVYTVSSSFEEIETVVSSGEVRNSD